MTALPPLRQVVDQELKADCEQLRDELEEDYDIEITGSWKLEELQFFSDTLKHGEERLREEGASDPAKAMKTILNGATVHRKRSKSVKCGTIHAVACAKTTASGKTTIILSDSTFILNGSKRPDEAIMRTIFHEIAHAWDKPSRRYSSTFPDTEYGLGGNEEFADAFADWMLLNESPQKAKDSSVEMVDDLIDSLFVPDPAPCPTNVPC